MLGLWRRWQIQNVIKDVHYHILAESSGNHSESFRGLFTHSCFFLAQSFDQHVDYLLKISFIDIRIVISVIIFVLVSIFIRSSLIPILD